MPARRTWIHREELFLWGSDFMNFPSFHWYPPQLFWLSYREWFPSCLPQLWQTRLLLLRFWRISKSQFWAPQKWWSIPVEPRTSHWSCWRDSLKVPCLLWRWQAATLLGPGSADFYLLQLFASPPLMEIWRLFLLRTEAHCIRSRPWGSSKVPSKCWQRCRKWPSRSRQFARLP